MLPLETVTIWVQAMRIFGSPTTPSFMSTAAAPILWFRLALTFAFGPPGRTREYPGRLPGSRPAARKLGALSAAALDAAAPAAAPAECYDFHPLASGLGRC